MATSVVFENQVEIPYNLQSLADFRRWALSDEFPERPDRLRRGTNRGGHGAGRVFLSRDVEVRNRRRRAKMG